jgi:hypothetical protein
VFWRPSCRAQPRRRCMPGTSPPVELLLPVGFVTVLLTLAARSKLLERAFVLSFSCRPHRKRGAAETQAGLSDRSCRDPPEGTGVHRPGPWSVPPPAASLPPRAPPSDAPANHPRHGASSRCARPPTAGPRSANRAARGGFWGPRHGQATSCAVGLFVLVITRHLSAARRIASTKATTVAVIRCRETAVLRRRGEVQGPGGAQMARGPNVSPAR